MIVVIFGVCGCGKTTVGEALARELQVVFRDADEFHSQANKDKMSQGVPLTDEDRLPWLLAIHQYIKQLMEYQKSGVVTCSALKSEYRTILLQGTKSASTECLPRKSVLFVLLNGSVETIRKRLDNRQGHFMPPSLLNSQFATLEIPHNNENHLVVDIEQSIFEIVHEIKLYMDLCK